MKIRGDEEGALLFHMNFLLYMCVNYSFNNAHIYRHIYINTCKLKGHKKMLIQMNLERFK